MNFFWRELHRSHRFLAWLKGWMHRRFTRTGLAVLGALTVAAVLGTDTDNSVAYQAFTLLVFLLLLALLLSLRFKLRYTATRQLPRFATAGQTFGYRVRVNGLGAKALRGLTVMERPANPLPTFQEWLAQKRADSRKTRSFRVSPSRNPWLMARTKEAPLPPTVPGQEAEARIEVTPLRRGVLRLEGLALARPEPLGLMRALASVSLPQTVPVLPRRYPIPMLALPGTMKYQEGGVTQASNVGQSDEFVSLRDYRHGDPLRHIHWRSWAKAGKPIVKEFEDEFFVRHALVLDTFIDVPHSELFEEAVAVAASFACSVLTQESLLDLLFVGAQAYCFTAGRGLAHSTQLLEVLAGVRPCTDQPFRTLEPLVLNHITSTSGCVCVLLAWDGERQEFVRKLKLLGLPLLVLVLVDASQKTELDPGPLQDEIGSFHVLEVGKIEAGLARL